VFAIMKKKFLTRLSGMLMAMFIAVPAPASVTIIGTRVIFPAKEKEVTIRLDNKGNEPALVQTWVDNGDPNQPLDKVKVPFILVPPVFRMEAHKGQTLRLIYTGDNLPTDKESVFWLNVLDVPPQNKKLADKNKLQMAIRSRIKIFYRPDGLTMEGADNAAKTLVWRRNRNTSTLTAYNNSPYHVNIARVDVEDATGKKHSSDKGNMVAPGGTQTFTVSGINKLTAKNNINYQYIDDYGSARSVDGTLSD